MEDSIFTKIIKGEVPSYRIYEDDTVYAFLDIHPTTRGHTLVVPKQQVEFVWDLDETTYIALTSATKNIALHLREVLGTPYVSEMVVGVDVPHAHIHLIPFHKADELKKAFEAQTDEPDRAALQEVADQLRM